MRIADLWLDIDNIRLHIVVPWLNILNLRLDVLNTRLDVLHLWLHIIALRLHCISPALIDRRQRRATVPIVRISHPASLLRSGEICGASKRECAQ